MKVIVVTGEDDFTPLIFKDFKAFAEDAEARGYTDSSDWPLVEAALKAGKGFTDATNCFRWIEVKE